jgi:hypothetical protein
MELDDLKSEWLRRDERLEELLRISRFQLQQSIWERHGVEVHRRSSLGVFYWVVFVLTAASLGVFMASEFGAPKFLVPALILQVWVIATHVATLLERDALLRLDFAAPVLTLQQQLEKLKQQRLRTFKWTFLSGQIVWNVPFMIVLFKGLLGFDLYAASDAMPFVMTVSVLVGLAFIPVAIWGSRQLAGRFQHSRLLQGLLDSLAGRDMQYSLSFVRRLQEFRDIPASNGA